MSFRTADGPRFTYVETWESWVVAMQAYHALFRIQAEPQGTESALLINHESRVVESIEDGPDLNATNWTDAFFHAFICRNEAMVDYLCQIPVETLRVRGESQGTVYASYLYHWVAALQSLVLNDGRSEEELAAAVEKSDPEVSGFGDEESVGKLVFPEMLVLLRLVERDSAAFNEALAAGVAAFGEYRTATESRAHDIEGVFPLGLLAFACMAYDISQVDPDFQLDVVSGYLPKHLVQHSWFNEFPI
ncbi:immunity 49 family protein [Nocardiopsis xinjiangensis]|uniref:immunity 49 family protein n=1 Tax=Nocardiopsis xinjiangensis TaxID=124285 RepID=UPI000A02240A|nr:immunity 49 family protein [Nocardiopsis xinjiangensis]